MNDPHVVSLHYIARSERDDVSYGDPAPIEYVTSLATYRLQKGMLEIRPSHHYAHQDAAREALEPFVRAWEMQADLEGRVGALRFHYRTADIIDRDPPPPKPGETTIYVDSTGHIEFSGGRATLTVTLGEYPKPFDQFNPDSEIVQDLMRRFQRWKNGKQELEHIAYYCATLLRSDAKWRISDGVFRTLQRLSSEKGGTDSSRKAGALPLCDVERQWIEKAIPAIIRQVAAVEAAATPEHLTMDELPPL